MFINALCVIFLKTFFASFCENQNRYFSIAFFHAFCWSHVFTLCFDGFIWMRCPVQARDKWMRKILAHAQKSRDYKKVLHVSLRAILALARVFSSLANLDTTLKWTNQNTKQKYADDKKCGKTQSYCRFGFSLIGWECGVRF